MEGSILVGQVVQQHMEMCMYTCISDSSIGRIQLSIWIQRSNDQSVGDL